MSVLGVTRRNRLRPKVVCEAWPVVPLDRLQRSVENLDRLASRPERS